MLTTTMPALTFAVILALLCGALYHYMRGGNGWRLLFYFGVSILGFAAGQGVSIWQEWRLLRFGMLDIGFGVLGSILFLIAGEWLSKVEINNDGESKV